MTLRSELATINMGMRASKATEEDSEMSAISLKPLAMFSAGRSSKTFLEVAVAAVAGVHEHAAVLTCDAMSL